MIIEVDWPIDFSAVKWINIPGKRSKREKGSEPHGEHGGWKRWLTSRAPTCNQGSWFSWWVIVSISINSNTVICLYIFFFFRFLLFCVIFLLSDVFFLSIQGLRQHKEICCEKSHPNVSVIFLHLISPRFYLLSPCRPVNYELTSGPVAADVVLCKSFFHHRGCRKFH